MTYDQYLMRRRAVMGLVRSANELYSAGAVMEAKLVLCDAVRLLLQPELTRREQLPPKLKHGIRKLQESHQISRSDAQQFVIANAECSTRSLRVLFNLVMRLLARMATLTVDGETLPQLDEDCGIHVYKRGPRIALHVLAARLLLKLRLRRSASLHARIALERLLGVTKKKTYTHRTSTLGEAGLITPHEQAQIKSAYSLLSRSVHGNEVPHFQTRHAVAVVGTIHARMPQRLEAAI